MISMLVASAIASASVVSTSVHKSDCEPQPLPPAIDSAGEVVGMSHSIEFAATPSLEMPGKAWVVRLVQGQSSSLEIIRLRTRNDCNAYVLDSKWQAPLDSATYEDVLSKVAQFGVPERSAIVPAHRKIFEPTAVDGTAISLRLQNHLWTISRRINLSNKDGSSISAIFREIVVRHVPPAELPDAEWRSR